MQLIVQETRDPSNAKFMLRSADSFCSLIKINQEVEILFQLISASLLVLWNVLSERLPWGQHKRRSNRFLSLQPQSALEPTFFLRVVSVSQIVSQRISFWHVPLFARKFDRRCLHSCRSTNSTEWGSLPFWELKLDCGGHKAAPAPRNLLF